MLYTCPRCQKYQSKRKANITRHLNRKKKCKKPTQTEAHTGTQEAQTGTQEAQKKIWKCIHCHKTFSTNRSWNRHMRLYCKENKAKQEIIKLREENQLLKNQIINIENNTNINAENINNYITNNTNNIIINAYGKEDLEHILPKLSVMIQHFPTTAVTDLICETYYDPEHPENKSVKIRSAKEKWAQVYNGQSWEMKNKKETILDVLQKSFQLIDEYFEMQNIDIPEYMKEKKNWIRFRDMWNNEILPDKEMKNIAEEILINQNQTNSAYRDFIQYKK